MAAKRYHQTEKDRRHEHRGEERAMHREHGRHGGHHSMDPRRRHEMEDAGMIHEDHKATANLPQDVKYHAWPETHEYPRYGLDDTIKGIDRQEEEDGRMARKHTQFGKY